MAVLETPTLISTVAPQTLLSVYTRLTHQMHGRLESTLRDDDPLRVKRNMVEAEILRRMESNA